MQTCSVEKYLQIEKGNLSDYQKLARFHYRDKVTGPYAAIWVMRNDSMWVNTVGVIVYTMPVINCGLRNKALVETLGHLSPAQRLAFVNKNIRCISRVIIEPRFRGLGLAAKLVRETMDKMDVPIIEAMAVLGHINPFFERAGMQRVDGDEPPLSVKIKDALKRIGIDKTELADAQQIQKIIEASSDIDRCLIEKMMHKFVGPYGRRRFLTGIEQLEFVLSRLAYRPVYYIRA
ncbi:MAG: hypothetical protein PHF37_04395 [Phycisphaerae bacterium]|nr:hypothetical protein [Phycisphaerae bacterium]